MLKYTLHTFTSSHITWVHITSIQLQPTKILIIIYIEIFEFRHAGLLLHDPPPKSFHTIAQRELTGQMEKKTFMDNGDIKETQIPGHIP